METKYLTGEWFEEYIGEKIRLELNLSEDSLLIGAIIRKTISEKQELNSPIELLNIDAPSTSPDNEIDIMFIKDNKFHVIECKTSIIAGTQTLEVIERNKVGVVKLDNDGNPMRNIIVKDINILGETIYKSDALKAKFGLYAKSYIFTLTDFQNYIKQNPNSLNAFVCLLKRASISNIKIVDQRLLDSQTQISNLL